MHALFLQPQTKSQFSLLQELAKAMSIPFRLMSPAADTRKDAFLAEVATAGRQARKIADGRMKGQTLDSLLDFIATPVLAKNAKL